MQTTEVLFLEVPFRARFIYGDFILVKTGNTTAEYFHSGRIVNIDPNDRVRVIVG